MSLKQYESKGTYRGGQYEKDTGQKQYESKGTSINKIERRKR